MRGILRQCVRQYIQAAHTPNLGDRKGALAAHKRYILLRLHTRVSLCQPQSKARAHALIGTRGADTSFRHAAGQGWFGVRTLVFQEGGGDPESRSHAAGRVREARGRHCASSTGVRLDADTIDPSAQCRPSVTARQRHTWRTHLPTVQLTHYTMSHLPAPYPSARIGARTARDAVSPRLPATEPLRAERASLRSSPATTIRDAAPPHSPRTRPQHCARSPQPAPGHAHPPPALHAAPL